ncbi:hypothetical protein LX64_00581 [Chitinophaga skermanii]|uniref:Alpha-galactosidase n=1 Tax=Chitinophaga skermanii TaxID=331697 RepID=A0A327R5J9_9BACT|nr:alpha-galactosidase [Chitinophaga skermanii]RAJ10974.1 hypothetical protein LX64_00581 [Chitinophaga skermanii]
MRLFLVIILSCFSFSSYAQQAKDWLINNDAFKTNIHTGNNQLTIENGLAKRVFVIQQNLACISYQQLQTGEQFIRAIRPEAIITLNNHAYNIGGLYGQPQQAYLLESWLTNLHAQEDDFQFMAYQVKEIDPYVAWKPNLWATNTTHAKGKELVLLFEHNAFPGLKVRVHYALYNGLPLICKWVTVENTGNTPVQVNQIVNEVLATPEEESAVFSAAGKMKTPHSLYIESNYAFNNAMKANLSDQTTHWKIDSSYTSQVNYDYQTPCLLEVYPPQGMNMAVQPQQSISSIRTYELLLDSYDRERNGLAQRRMYRAIAPWTTQNPIFMHLVTTDSAKVLHAIDQCAATGYEGVILSFGSGLNMEDTSAANIRRFKYFADYAHGKKILLGGYSLFSSRRISEEDDVIDPETGERGHAFFGNAPCLGSNWGLAYLSKLKRFIAATGFDIFENDGPYPGDVCASTKHPGHKDQYDAQWAQMQLQKSLYHWLNERGVYINAPDWYFLDGTHKIGLGYREVNFSLPREQQMILNRQNIFDGTWEKTPSMGWGFVPLTEYQGGGKAATIEPLHEHITTYQQLMMQYYGAGIQACYRGPRLYDTNDTKQMVTNTIAWYKRYRTILNADIIHLRRADGRDWDGIMHVLPGHKERALVMLYNPLTQPITRNIQLPLYYTGIAQTASMREQEGAARKYKLGRDYSITITVTIPAGGYTWYVVESKDE